MEFKRKKSPSYAGEKKDLYDTRKPPFAKKGAGLVTASRRQKEVLS